MEKPVSQKGGIVALFGSLAPNGAILKRAAADESALRARVSAPSSSRISPISRRASTRPISMCDADDALILRRAGPRACGMPEAGYIPIPRKLAEKGVKDMLRISDARMSGTAYGTIVLHVSPEAEADGPIGSSAAATGSGFPSPSAGSILRSMRPSSSAGAPSGRAPAPGAKRGWQLLYRDHVLQAEDGCDLDFLTSA